MQGSNLTTELLINQAHNDYNTKIINNTWSTPSDEQRQVVALSVELKTIKDNNIDLSRSVLYKLKEKLENIPTMRPGGRFKALVLTPCKRMGRPFTGARTIIAEISTSLVRTKPSFKLTQRQATLQPLVLLRMQLFQCHSLLDLQPPWHHFRKKPLVMNNEGRGNVALHPNSIFGSMAL